MCNYSHRKIRYTFKPPQPDYPAASVAQFVTSAYSHPTTSNGVLWGSQISTAPVGQISQLVPRSPHGASSQLTRQQGGETEVPFAWPG
jgi:hypothetical protein